MIFANLVTYEVSHGQRRGVPLSDSAMMAYHGSLSYILVCVLLMLEASKGWSHNDLTNLTEEFKELQRPPSFVAVRALQTKYASMNASNLTGNKMSLDDV